MCRMCRSLAWDKVRKEAMHVLIMMFLPFKYIFPLQRLFYKYSVVS